MPELPEVETVVRDLRPLLAGRTIASARQSRWKLRRPWKPVWNAKVAGARVEAVRRRGKWILIDLLGEPGASATGCSDPPLHPVAVGLQLLLLLIGRSTMALVCRVA